MEDTTKNDNAVIDHENNTATTTGRKTKRKLKEVDTFQPDNFNAAGESMADVLFHQLPTEPGRGTSLDQLPVVKSSITQAPSNPNLITAYKFVFGKKYGASPQINHMRTRLLEFSGYLQPLVVENYDDEKQDAADTRTEKRYNRKAGDLHYNEVRMLCDTFGVNRTNEDPGRNVTKDTLIDRLLDFLSCPHESMVKKTTTKFPTTTTTTTATSTSSKSSGSTNKSKTTVVEKKVSASRSSNKKAKVAKASKTVKKKGNKNTTTTTTKSKQQKKEKKQKTESDDDDDKDKDKDDADADPFHLIRNHTKGVVPSDDALRQWVSAYVVCFDLITTSTRDALDAAAEKFGVDLTPTKKKFIKKLIADELEKLGD
mmetsp:Transcript_61246/g.149928  ORF Transcript_61246/g.149928 Transcript_61246/m.149928 type:complete len:370 (+) Transcript_61246:126-1235(+)